MDMNDLTKLMQAGQVFFNTAIPMEQEPWKFWKAPIEQSQVRQKDTIDYIPYIIDDTLDQSTADDTDVQYVHNLGRVPRRAIAIAWPSNHWDAAGWTGMSFGFWADNAIQSYSWSLHNQNSTNIKSSFIKTTDDSERGFAWTVVSVDENYITINRTRATVDNPARDVRFFIVVFP